MGGFDDVEHTLDRVTGDGRGCVDDLGYLVDRWFDRTRGLLEVEAGKELVRILRDDARVIQ